MSSLNRFGNELELILENPLIMFAVFACMKCLTALVGKEVLEIDRRKALILLLVVVAVAAIGGIVLMGYSVAEAQTPVNGGQWRGCGAGWFIGNLSLEMQGMPYGGMRKRCCFSCGFIDVSDEFKANVINIAKGDVDVQNLLNEGYNITRVNPIVKAVVTGDGTVSVKATGAILTLEKGTTGRAIVRVDLENVKVTEITILTKTIIRK
ncbi:MAG: hypothetical protein QXW82_05540 [Candidatus Bathyarchaeia archaeon]